MTKIASVFSVMLFSGIAIYGQDFIIRWIGRDYAQIPTVILILVPAYLLSACQRPSMSILFALSRHRVLAYILVAEGLVNLLLSILLVHPYGIVGVAAGTAIPSIINYTVVMPLYVCHHIKMSSRSYYGTLISGRYCSLLGFSLIFANLFRTLSRARVRRNRAPRIGSIRFAGRIRMVCCIHQKGARLSFRICREEADLVWLHHGRKAAVDLAHPA